MNFFHKKFKKCLFIHFQSFIFAADGVAAVAVVVVAPARLVSFSAVAVVVVVVAVAAALQVPS